jgi:hypothetical protein
LFRADSARGIRPSERSPPGGCGDVSTLAAPPTVTLTVGPADMRQGGPVMSGSWGHSRRKFLAAGCAVNAPTAGCSHGLPPLQGSHSKTSTRISPGLLSRALPTSGISAGNAHSPAGTPESQSVSAWPCTARAFARRAAKATLGVSHLYIPCPSTPARPWLCVHLAPRRTLLPTARCASDRTRACLSGKGCRGYDSAARLDHLAQGRPPLLAVR